MKNNYHQNLIKFLNTHKIKFKNLKLYKQSFRHKTFTNEHRHFESYDLLEFVGDALIQMKASLQIYNHFYKIDEGNASLIRAKNVNTEALAKIANNLKMNKLLVASNNIEELKNNFKINADIYEAFCAAVYLDAGEEMLDKFLKNTLFKYINHTNVQNVKDPKSIFQEYTQSYSTKSIVYDLIKLKNGSFKAKLFHNNVLYSTGFGKTKKQAEFNAATKALAKVEKRKDEIS